MFRVVIDSSYTAQHLLLANSAETSAVLEKVYYSITLRGARKAAVDPACSERESCSHRRLSSLKSDMRRKEIFIAPASFNLKVW